MTNNEDLFTVETHVQYRRTNQFRWKEVGNTNTNGLFPHRSHKSAMVLQQLSLENNGTRRWDDVPVVGIGQVDFESAP